MPSLKIDHRRVKQARSGNGWGVRRREALQLLAANMALIAAGCSKPEEEIVPYVTMPERLVPGVVHSYESCADYLPLGEPGRSTDRAGCVNTLTSKRYITPTSTAMAPNSCLVQVEKWEGQE